MLSLLALLSLTASQPTQSGSHVAAMQHGGAVSVRRGWSAHRAPLAMAAHTERAVNLDTLLNPEQPDPLSRKARIVATLGPASLNEEMLTKLIAAGVDIFRLNSSHRRPGQFEELVPLIRRLSSEAGRDVKLLGDLQGPKFRCSNVKESEGESIPLEVGQEVEFALMTDDDDETRAGRITLAPTTEQTALMAGLKEDIYLLLDDGFMKLQVTEVISESAAKAKVVVGGKLKSRKGINVPQLQIACSAMTVKDKEDAKFLLGVGVDYMAMSFVQKGADIQELIDLMKDAGVDDKERPMIIPKIEKPQALMNIDEILALSDGLMVARGDLGVECGLERVPPAQKMLIKKANEAGKMVITATQMLESMISAAVPTRAEVSDVANAVFDGTDAVMLSGESAMGVNPDVAVRQMGSIVAEAELHMDSLQPSI